MIFESLRCMKKLSNYRTFLSDVRDILKVGGYVRAVRAARRGGLPFESAKSLVAEIIAIGDADLKAQKNLSA